MWFIWLEFPEAGINPLFVFSKARAFGQGSVGGELA
jgi:hypothetical protein